MTIGNHFALANDSEFRLLANFASPPRAGRVTAIEASGQVRVATDDPDGGDVLAWPLNGFEYAVDDVVYIAFAANSPDTALVIGSKAPLPTLGAGVTVEGYVSLSGVETISGSKTFTSAVNVGDGSAAAQVLLNGAAGTPRAVVGRSNGLSRWSFSIADGSAESGGNAGSDFSLTRFDDAGVFIDSPWRIERDTGFMGLTGLGAPQGKFHAHDGTGGMIFVTKTGITNSAQTLIANGAGDVTSGIAGFLVVDEGSGAVASTFTLLPGDTFDVVVGGYTLRLALAANGALTCFRQSGTGAASLAMLAVWM